MSTATLKAPQPGPGQERQERTALADKLHLAPEDDFPEDLKAVPNPELQVLDSQIQRQLDYEIVAEGEINPETDFRHAELDEEFADRDDR